MIATLTGRFFRQVGPVRSVDTGVSAEQIRDSARDGEAHGVCRAKQFDAHHGAGEGSVGGSGEDRDKTKSCEEIDRCAEENREGVAEGGADKEKRRDLAALKTAAERNGAEQKFPPPAPRRGAVDVERRENRHRPAVRRRDANPKVVAGADEMDQRDDHHAVSVQQRQRAIL